MRQKYFLIFMLIGLFGLTSCGKITDAPSESSGQDLLKEYFSRTENQGIEIFDFKKLKGSSSKKDKTIFHVMDFRSKIELPKTAWGVERRDIKGTLGFIKKPDGKDWEPDQKFKIKVFILATKINFHGVKPHYHSENPVYGAFCPRNNQHFIKVKSVVCESCKAIDQAVETTWTEQLTCLDCGGNGQCAYCAELSTTFSLKCELCRGTGQCSACDGSGQCKYCAGSGKSEGKKCETCGGTGKCVLCQGTTKCKYCAGTGIQSLKCESCDGTGKCFYCSKLETPGKDFGKEHRLEDCKFCRGTGKCITCLGSGRTCYFCSGTKVCRYCHGKKSFGLSDFNSDGTLKQDPGN
ncbi:MAG: hypothetical protein AAB019_08115 [Planctomycetota bacterium]